MFAKADSEAQAAGCFASSMVRSKALATPLSEERERGFFAAVGHRHHLECVAVAERVDRLGVECDRGETASRNAGAEAQRLGGRGIADLQGRTFVGREAERQHQRSLNAPVSRSIFAPCVTALS